MDINMLHPEKKRIKKKNSSQHVIIKNVTLTACVLTISTFLAFLFYYLGNNTTSVAIIYILAVVFISRYSDGYAPGIIASLIGVVCVNYVFTYPFMKINFTMDGYPITFLGMVIISSIISTMTSHLKLQNKIIQEREKMLMEAEKETMRANLLRAISHDLRTPLTGIIGTCSAYLENLDKFTKKEQNDLIQNIYEDANWLLNMVENLLTITRIRTNDAHIHKTSELLEEVVSEAVQRLKKRIPHAEIKVQIPNEFIMIPMDPILIEQVLINLMENAYYHGTSEEPILLEVSLDHGRACFKIIDYGMGIPEETLTTIFEGKPATPSQSGDSRKGMGIGLTICRTIIIAHGGEIFASNHKNGAELTFYLPLEEEKEDES